MRDWTVGGAGNNMRVIGITGGVGARQTAPLGYVKEHYRCRVILADEVAHLVEKPGQRCYDELVKLLGTEMLHPDGTIDKRRMAEKIFADSVVLKQVNDIVHPAVKEYILQEIARERRTEEVGYIYAQPELRRRRLKEGRAYSDEKIDRILKEQLSEEAFRQHCGVVIDNSGSLAGACRQIDEKLEEYLWQK